MTDSPHVARKLFFAASTTTFSGVSFDLRTTTWQKYVAVPRSARIRAHRLAYHSTRGSKVMKKKKSVAFRIWGGNVRGRLLDGGLGLSFVDGGFRC